MLAASVATQTVPGAGMQFGSMAAALTATQKAAVASLPSQPGAASSPASTGDPRLDTAAHQFEAAMMQELLGPLTKQMEGMDGMSEDDDEDGSNQALTSFASEALGEALSLHGGFGIASSVLKKLKTEVAERNPSGKGAFGLGRVTASKVTGMGRPKRNGTSVGNQNRISSKSLPE